MLPKIARSSKRSKLAGFSLVEVVLVILALGLLFLPVLHYFFGMTKATTDSWSAVKAFSSAQTVVAEIQATDPYTVLNWDGRNDTVGNWTRTVQVYYVNMVGGAFVQTASPTRLYSVQVTLKGIRNETIVLSTIVEAPDLGC
jgi:type II secretory pathway pseudopilin PulG